MLVEVFHNAMVDGECMSCVNVWERVEDAVAASSNAVTFRRQDNPRYLSSNEIVTSATYFSNESLVTALVPAFLH